MKKSEFVEQVILAGRREHQSRKTWQCYAGWASRFARWLQGQVAITQFAAQVTSPLDHPMAPAGNVVPFVQSPMDTLRRARSA